MIFCEKSAKILSIMRWDTTYAGVLGRIIARERKRANLDQAQMSEKTGINRSTLSRMEHGVTTPDAVQLKIIANALGMRPEDLYAKADEMSEDLKTGRVKVHMAKEPSGKSTNKAGAFLLGAALGAIITALATAKDSPENDEEK